MKYQDYTKLTSQQKEEYDFKFKDKPGIHGSGYLLLFVALKAQVVMFLMASIFAYKMPELASLQPAVEGMMLAAGTLLKVAVPIFVVLIICDIVSMIWHDYKEKKWLKGAI